MRENLTKIFIIFSLPSFQDVKVYCLVPDTAYKLTRSKPMKYVITQEYRVG